MIGLSTRRVQRSLRRLVDAVVDRTRGARSEAGDTLIEVLLAIIVLSLASVALITAFETDISASAEHRNLANFDTALASSMAMTSSVIQDGYTSVFNTCPTPSDSLAAYPPESVLTSSLDINGYTAQIAASGTQPAVEYSAGDGTYTATCTNATANSSGNVGEPQLINVVVTDTATGLSRSDTVIVVDPVPVQAGGANSNAASQLLFTTEPEGATVGAPFTTQPAVEVLDSTGHIVNTNIGSITLSIDPALGTPGAVLSPCPGQETSGIVDYSGCSINEIGTGYELEATEGSLPNELTAYSTPFSVYSAQIPTPTITNVAPSPSLAGALVVTFTSPPNSQSFTAKACTDVSMSLNCVTAATITSGGSITGLTQGSDYYVQVTASATGNYLASTTPPYQPAVMATVQLVAPGGVAASAGTVAGSLVVSFTPPAPPALVAPNQVYTVTACTNSNMSAGCVTNTNYTQGSNLTGLNYTAGGATSFYYVDVLANGSVGYLASPPSTPAVESSAVESAVKTPTGFSAAPSASQIGAIVAVFTEPTGTVAPSSFTATLCTNSAMTAGCITVPNYTSNSQISGLNPGSSYYVTITAVSSTPGFASATTGVSPATLATVQLVAPTGLSANYGTAAGTITISFTPPVTVAPGQTYTATACTNSGMTVGCVTNANYASGSNLSGPTYTIGSPGTNYFITVTANPSSGYLVSPASSQVSQADTSQLAAPTAVAVGYGTTVDSISVAFTPPTTVAAGQTYTLKACTNGGMTAGCVTNTNFTSGSNVANLNAVTAGTPGTTYFVQITSNASIAYVASTPSVVASHAEMSQIGQPGTPVVSTGSTTGSIVATFGNPPGSAPSSYTAMACTNAQMSTGCVTKTGYTSGAQFTGLVSGTSYFVQITAIGPAGYLNNTSNTSRTSGRAR
jgi:type II secretory pathway pseudopilin PulG